MAVNAGACSSTSGSIPAILRAIAVARPPVPPPAMITRTSAPESLRRDAGALREGGELRPAHLRVDFLRCGLGREAAVVADHHVLPADEFRVPHGQFGDELGVLDPVRAVAQHA